LEISLIAEEETAINASTRKVATNNALPLKAARRDAIAKLNVLGL